MINVVVAGAVVLLWFQSASTSFTEWQVHAEESETHQHHDQAHDRSAYPLVHADTKYWIRSTEFGERDNWINQLRPCTLFERIRINEQSVVSMGSSMDALGGSLLNGNIIKELTLAQNGILLLEEDLPDDPIESAFIDYLKLIGDCVDGESLRSSEADPSGPLAGGKHLFEFEPDEDETSWFNPDNWSSTQSEYNLEEWIPESHQVPCGEDEVVFGDRHGLLASVLETGERDKTISFKVNFRPSKASQQQANDATTLINSIDSLRVSKLLIGERHYDQVEFGRLINSEDYKDILFQFNDSKSALKQDHQLYSSDSLPLTIDETSLTRDSSRNLCLDEAGCLCGNERAEVMKVICSFHEPLGDDDLPCLDPIYSVGHCNRICATSLTISMDPGRFSESFVVSVIEKLMRDDSQAGSVLVGPRRIDDDRYEVLFRYIPSHEDHWSSVGVELNFAQSIKRQLSRDSTKSFYGIKTITLRSSERWRRNNRGLLFWLIATTLSMVSVAIIACKNPDSSNNFSNDTSGHAHNWLAIIWDQMKIVRNPVDTESESFMGYESQPTPNERYTSVLHGSLSNIPLVELDGKEDHE